MVRFLCLLGLTLLALHGAQSTDPSVTVNTVECTPQGFQPTFKYDLGSVGTQTLSVQLVLGDDDTKTWCVGSTPTDGTPAEQQTSVTITKATLDALYTSSGGTDYIPFTQDTADSGADGDGTSDVPRCGGVFEHWTDSSSGSAVEKIKYEVDAELIVTRRYRDVIDRKIMYPFKIRCDVERSLDSIKTDYGFTVNTQLVEEVSSVDVTDTLTYVASMIISSQADYSAATQALAIDNDDKVYLKISQGANQELFKYVVEKCYATVSDSPTPADNAHKDVFLDSQCATDSTVTLTNEIDPNLDFKIEMDVFSFPGQESTNVFFHCELTICLATDNTANVCIQKTEATCISARNDANFERRRRRSAEGVIGQKTITSSASILRDRSQLIAPSCGNAFIYDRVLGECSNENLLEINGIYLGEAAWNPAYANVTSEEFKSMAAAREYQLWVLLQVTRRSEYIHGVKIIRARSGSVILDVIIKYAASVSAEEAFHQMEQALKTKPSTTRVMNLLQIREEKTIEYVPIVSASEKSDTEKLILIVVVVVLFVVVFIAGVTLFKVKQVRQRAGNTGATGFENKGVDA